MLMLLQAVFHVSSGGGGGIVDAIVVAAAGDGDGDMLAVVDVAAISYRMASYCSSTYSNAEFINPFRTAVSVWGQMGTKDLEFE